jgi:tetratricopeptide (TPR) repeat protein
MSESEEPPATRIRIEGLPRISELLSALLYQLQLAGLFVAYYGTAPKKSDKDFLERFGLRPALLDSIIAVAELHLSEKVVLEKVPVISNRVRWSDPTKLGGYLSVKSSEVLASYLGCWQHAAQYPDSAPFRFLRVAFWYWHQQNDFFSSLKLIIDLNKSGFFLQADHFEIVAHSLCDAYTQGFDISSLHDHNFNSEAGDKSLLDTIEATRKRSHDDDKVRELFDWVADVAMEEAEGMRNAASADEWVHTQATLRSILAVLIFIQRRHSEDLGATQKAIASQLEEVLADLFGNALVTHLIAREGRPLELNFHGLQGVGVVYQGTYGADWIDKVLEDRILAPAVLREHIEAAYAGAALPTVRQIELPPEWRMVSPLIAWSICVAFDRDLMLERSVDFNIEEVNAACLELGYQPKPDGVLDQFESIEQAAARRKLSILALQELWKDPVLFGEDAAAAIENLKTLVGLYPWNHIVWRELGIRYDQSGDADAGFRMLRKAILLDPAEAMNWQSFSVVLNRLGDKQDAIFAAAICEMINQKESS